MSAIKEKPISWLKSSIDTDPSICVNADTPLVKASEGLLKSPHNLIAIVKDDVVEAVATPTDITQGVANLAQKKLETDTPIIDVANVKNFIKISKSDTVDVLLNTILKHKFDDLLILDDNQKFYGVLNRKKLADELEEYMS